MMNKKILVTGAAGFIGYHICKRLLKENFKVLGLDNLNDYYEISLKKSRLNKLKEISIESKLDFEFIETDLQKFDNFQNIFVKFAPQIVINLAAQAGVRYSIKKPFPYISSNIIGFHNLLELCRNYQVEHLLYASSSSVYGGNSKIPFLSKIQLIIKQFICCDQKM